MLADGLVRAQSPQVLGLPVPLRTCSSGSTTTTPACRLVRTESRKPLTWSSSVVRSLQLLVDGLQLVVRRLQLLVHGLELLVGGLELLVGGLQLLDRGLELLVGGLQLLVGRLQLLVGALQLAVGVLELVLHPAVPGDVGKLTLTPSRPPPASRTAG